MAHQTTTAIQTRTGDNIQLGIFSATTPAPASPQSLPTTTLPPLIYHITIPEGLTISTTPHKLLTETLALSDVLITQITTFGAFYIHIPRPRASPRAERGTLQILHTELPLRERVYIRLHLHPKRYLNRHYQLIDQEFHILAFYKPPELPVCAGVDNSRECLTAFSRAFVTTRIDVGTSGVVLMTRKKEIVKLINHGLKTGVKYYIVFAEFRGVKEVVETVWRDWYRAKPALSRGERPPILRKFELGNSAQWVEARLEIVQRNAMKFSNGKGRVFIVKLCTGRTHQIRVQMAARGYWVVGDGKYEDVVGKVYESGVLGGDARRLGLHCWLVFCRRWWSAELRSRKDLCELVDEDGGFWEWLKRVETRLREL